MKLYYIVNARMPSEKAHGIQIAKMAEAFVEAGVDLTLILPKRSTDAETIKSYYGLRTTIKTQYLPVVNWYTKGRIGFFISSLSFMVAYALFLILAKKKGEHFSLYSVDMDTFSYVLLPLFGKTAIEIHSPKKKSIANTFFFKHASLVVATNTLISNSLRATFGLKEKTCIIAPNGFDITSPTLSQKEARVTLGISQDAKIALYVGRVLPWKGMDILPKALHNLPENSYCYLVGVTSKEITKLAGDLPVTRFIAVGDRPSYEIPTWLAAADIGIVLGTKKNESSYRYTSPMKMFEYIGAGLPIVASKTPALTDILTEEDAFFYTPDDPESLREIVIEALSSPVEAYKKAHHVKDSDKLLSWKNRTREILTSMQQQKPYNVH